MNNDIEKHVGNLVNFYKSGIKKNSQKLGVELEWTLVHNDNSQVEYFEKYGQKWLMEKLIEDFSENMLDEGNNLIGVKNSRDSITLEPAGQFELSAGPFETIKEVKTTFEDFFTKINSIENPHGIKMIPTGYHPKLKASDLKLIPKVRYELMNEYFLKNSPLGIRMMRATGSTQVSIDYSSESDCIKKLRIAYLLCPILSLLCDNTPTFEGKTRTHHIMRTQVWQDCDKKRCGIVPGIFDSDFTFETYARYVLNTQAMFEMDGNSGHLTNKTTSEVYDVREMDACACAHASSHLFNDVRLKNFIEIRPADALPTDVLVAYVSLIKGIFYNTDSLNLTEELLSGNADEEIKQAFESIKKFGFDAMVYNKKVSDISKNLIEIAKRGLNDEEEKELFAIEQIVNNKETLAQKISPL